MSRRFDAVLFDAGGVLLLPDPSVFGPLLGYYGGDPSIDAHRRAHYAGMHAKSVADAPENEWAPYTDAYLDAIGVRPAERAAAGEVFDATRGARLWRWVIPETRVALDVLAEADVPMGVVSNAYGQIEEVLARDVCQVGAGDHVAMRCIVDSHLVGVAKPDPSIFDHALPHFAEFDRGRIAYVGDSVTMDVGAARGAGLYPILIDPYDDHDGAEFERVRSVTELAVELVA
jgi:FMN phosphatase YigB (HAD superfamily)